MIVLILFDCVFVYGSIDKCDSDLCMLAEGQMQENYEYLVCTVSCLCSIQYVQHPAWTVSMRTKPSAIIYLSEQCTVSDISMWAMYFLCALATVSNV